MGKRSRSFFVLTNNTSTQTLWVYATRIQATFAWASAPHRCFSVATLSRLCLSSLGECPEAKLTSRKSCSCGLSSAVTCLSPTMEADSCRPRSIIPGQWKSHQAFRPPPHALIGSRGTLYNCPKLQSLQGILWKWRPKFFPHSKNLQCTWGTHRSSQHTKEVELFSSACRLEQDCSHGNAKTLHILLPRIR